MTTSPDHPRSDLQAAELAELNDLLWSLPSTLDPYAIVAVLLDKGARMFRAPLSCVYLKEAGTFELAGAYGFTDKKAEQLWGRLELAERGAQPLHLQGAELQALSGFGKRRLGAVLAMPLHGPQGLLGWVIFARLEPSPFSELEQHFIEVILDRVAPSIVNARLFQETESRSHELALLYEIAELLVSTLHLNELMDQLTRRMVETFDLTICAIRLSNPVERTLTFKAFHHRDPEERARLEGQFASPDLEGTGLTGQILKQRKPYVSRSVPDDPLILPAYREAFGPGSLVAAPLVVREQALGVLFWFRSGRQRPLTESLVPLVSRLAKLVAVAIENARLVQDMETKISERTADLKAANERLEARAASSKAYMTATTLALRSQLHNLLGFGDLMQHRLENGAQSEPEQVEYLEKMLNAGETVNTLVEDLLNRLRTGELG